MDQLMYKHYASLMESILGFHIAILPLRAKLDYFYAILHLCLQAKQN